MDLDAKSLAAIVALIGAASIAGVAGGSVIGQAPIMNQAGVGGERPVSDFGGDISVGSGGYAEVAPAPRPDRFAINTPEGRFEVSEWRDRGNDRNRRYSDFDRALAAERLAIDESHTVPDPGFADRAWNDAGGMPPLSTAPRVAVPVRDGEVEPSRVVTVRVHSGESVRGTAPASAGATAPAPATPTVEPPAPLEPAAPPVVTARIY